LGEERSGSQLIGVDFGAGDRVRRRPRETEEGNNG
jgi:hypothetical protein